MFLIVFWIIIDKQSFNRIAGLGLVQGRIGDFRDQPGYPETRRPGHPEQRRPGHPKQSWNPEVEGIPEVPGGKQENRENPFNQGEEGYPRGTLENRTNLDINFTLDSTQGKPKPGIKSRTGEEGGLSLL